MLDQSPVETLTAFLSGGTLKDKYTQSKVLLESGDSVFFDGSIEWQIFLIEEDKAFKGQSPNVDGALIEMNNNFAFLMESYADDTEIICVMNEGNHA